MDKQAIRREIKERKLRLTEAERQKAANTVFAALERTGLFTKARRIMAYHSLPDELPTDDMLHRWATRKDLFLPRVNGDELEILPYRADTLSPGAFAIAEPQEGEPVSAESIDLIIVPAVAFDRHGNRLGRGRGFYDRLLATTTATTIGVGYDFQLLDTVPVEPHDRPLDMVATPSEIIIQVR